MYKITYSVELKDYSAELEWLNDLKIYPAQENSFRWTRDKFDPVPIIRLGMVVDSESLLLIKLRHNINFQVRYEQRK